MPTRNGLFHLARPVLNKPKLGMESRVKNDTSSVSSRVSFSAEENQMIFCILKELDLFLENEEATLRRESSKRDKDEIKDNYSKKRETEKVVETSNRRSNSDRDEDETDKKTKEVLENGVKNKNGAEAKKENQGICNESEGTSIVQDEEETSDEDDDDDTVNDSFGMPIADACAECFHAQIKAALANAVRNSHVTCLQAILEQLALTREAMERKRHRNKRMAKTKSVNGHVQYNKIGMGGEDITNEPNLAASPLLLEAVTRGHSQVVHLILKCLQDLQQLHDALLVSDSQGKRAIHIAAYLNHTGCLDLLLLKTPIKRVFWRDKHGRTPLLVAAAGGAVQCLKRLMTVDDLGATSNSGATAVCFAAEAGSVGCLEVLLDQAMLDPTISDEAGMTPLHFAAEAGHLNCTHWLVRRASCSLNVQRKKDGATPMHLAAAKGRCPILQWALNRELSCGDELDYFGRTPVHYAAEEGHITALKTFAKFVKVDLCAKDFLGRTPSHLAERRGHLGCVRYLDSSSKHKRSDGETDRPGKISRSLSSSNVNKLVRRGSGRRSAKRRGVSSVYVEGTSSNGVGDHLSLDAYLSGRKSGSIVPKMVTQVGLMSLATVLPDADFLKEMIRSESGNVKAEET